MSIAMRRSWPPVPPDVPPGVDEHDLYPDHEEDRIPLKPRHELQTRYLRDALAARFPSLWATGEISMYWEKGNPRKCVLPDVVVIDCPPPKPLPSTYLKWVDPPVLVVMEIGSKSTFRRDEKPKVRTYEVDLASAEYLYFHPDREELRFFRMGAQGYQRVAPDARGRVYSEMLELWFGPDEEGWLRAYTADGERLLTHEESEHARREAEHARREAEHAREQAEAAAAALRRVAELEAEMRRLRAGDA